MQARALATVRTSVQCSKQLYGAQTRLLSSSSTASSPAPIKYGNGPLYRNVYKLAPRDPITQSEAPVLRMLMFGKPGSGKGTLSNKLIKKYDVSQLSAGDLLRAHIAEGTEVGRVAEGIIASGGLVPDDIITKVITSKLDLLQRKSWILDGFPRTVGQGRMLDTHLRNTANPLTLIVHLDIPDEVILNRINDRWVHLPSGRVYNLTYNPPKVAGFDDVTGEALAKRPDDNPDVASSRLKSFYDSTSPVLDYYTSAEARASTKMVTLTGKTSDEIWPQLERIITSEFRLKPRAVKASTQEAILGNHGPLYARADLSALAHKF